MYQAAFLFWVRRARPHLMTAVPSAVVADHVAGLLCRCELHRLPSGHRWRTQGRVGLLLGLVNSGRGATRPTLPTQTDGRVDLGPDDVNRRLGAVRAGSGHPSVDTWFSACRARPLRGTPPSGRRRCCPGARAQPASADAERQVLPGHQAVGRRCPWAGSASRRDPRARLRPSGLSFGPGRHRRASVRGWTVAQLEVLSAVALAVDVEVVDALAVQVRPQSWPPSAAGQLVLLYEPSCRRSNRWGSSPTSR